MSRLEISKKGLREALSRHQTIFVPALPGRRNHRQAGVMIPLFWDKGVHCLATLRPKTMGDHGGEVCFPGGKPEPGDLNLQATAERELKEELGIGSVQILGELSSIPLFTSDYRIQPFVCSLASRDLVTNTDEVERTLWFSLDAIFNQPWIEGFTLHVGGIPKTSPVIVVDGECMFGATAYALLELLGIIGLMVGREVPPIRATKYRWDPIHLRPVLDEGR